MTTHTNSQALYYTATAQLRDADLPTPGLDAKLLLLHTLQCSAEDWLRQPPLMSNEQVAQYHHLVTRRIAREPIGKICGYKPFWKHNFHVNAHVLEPRPDSETLIEAALAHAKQPRTVLDIGTGSGCLLLSLLHEWPHAHGVGVDISAQALNVAKNNAQTLACNQAYFVQASFSSACAPHQWDVVISNPPYIPHAQIAGLDASVREYDPHLALNGGEDGLDAYRAILTHAAALLSPTGILILEAGQHQADDIMMLAQQHQLQHVAQVHDLQDIPRALVFQA